MKTVSKLQCCKRLKTNESKQRNCAGNARRFRSNRPASNIFTRNKTESEYEKPAFGLGCIWQLIHSH